MIVTDSAAGTAMMTGTPSIHRFVSFSASPAAAGRARGRLPRASSAAGARDPRARADDGRLGPLTSRLRQARLLAHQFIAAA